MCAAAAMNQALIHPLQLGSQYPLASEQECMDGMGSHAHHSSYAPGGVPDPLRRDGSLGQSASSLLSLPQSNGSNGVRYMAHRPAAHDGQFHQPSGVSDSGSGSISTSPRSTASSLAYSPFQSSNLYQGVPQSYSQASQLFASPAGYSQQPSASFAGMSTMRRMSSLNDHSGMLPPARSPAIGNPVSPSLSATARDNYTTATPHLNRHTTLSPRSHADSSLNRGSYSSVPETPRSVLTPGAGLSLSPSSGMPYASAGAMLTYSSQHDVRNKEGPPFDKQENFHEILSDGQVITPHIECRVEKGFFVSPDSSWTCYRRNYFSVQCSYSLNPHIPNGRLYLNRSDRNSQEQIQAIAVTLSAAVDAPAGKSIDLVQHTPKRDKGPQMQIQMERLAPTPPGKTHADAHGYPINAFHTSSSMASPYLPLQVDPEQPYSPAGTSTTSHQHIFERIQFKSATANNGKRRAQQQYYHLIVELCVDVRKPHDPEPEWVRIAQKVSAAVVVRGRSPSHYQHEGPHGSSASRGGPGTGGGAGGPAGAAYGGSGIQNVGGRGLGNGLAMLGGAGMGGGVYRGSQYPLDPSPIGSHSVSSASSISGGPVEGLVGEQGMTEEEEGKTIDHYDGYQYYPSPIAEAGLPVGMKSEYDPVKRIKVEYSDSTLQPSPWSMGGCGRFQGTETSRGYYPSDLHTGY